MMFAGGPLKVVLATVHMPLMGLWGKLNIGAVFQPIELMHEALVELVRHPQAAHRRRRRQSARQRERPVRRRGRTHHRPRDPAWPASRASTCTGPYPPDTVFLAARDGKFDAVVAMYHDQGLIPVKLLAFDQAVNLTLGLPIIRTSPDHGTAFDIVGRNRANPGSMRAAIELAIDLAVQAPHSHRSTAPTNTAAMRTCIAVWHGRSPCSYKYLSTGEAPVPRSSLTFLPLLIFLSPA